MKFTYFFYFQKSAFSLFAYDATKLFLIILNESLKEFPGDMHMFKNGTYMFQKSRDRTFSGIINEAINLSKAKCPKCLSLDNECEGKASLYKVENH